MVTMWTDRGGMPRMATSGGGGVQPVESQVLQRASHQVASWTLDRGRARADETLAGRRRAVWQQILSCTFFQTLLTDPFFLPHLHPTLSPFPLKHLTILPHRIVHLFILVSNLVLLIDDFVLVFLDHLVLRLHASVHLSHPAHSARKKVLSDQLNQLYRQKCSPHLLYIFIQFQREGVKIHYFHSARTLNVRVLIPATLTENTSVFLLLRTFSSASAERDLLLQRKLWLTVEDLTIALK